MRGLDDLKETFDTAIKAKNIEVKPENIKFKLDIYLDSNSQMETDEVECIDLTTDTDSETSDVTVENYGRHVEKNTKLTTNSTLWSYFIKKTK